MQTAGARHVVEGGARRHALVHYRVTAIASDPNSVEPNRLRVALGPKPAHTRGMTSRRFSYVISKRDEALLRRADVSGLTALLAAFRFGMSHVHQPS